MIDSNTTTKTRLAVAAKAGLLQPPGPKYGSGSATKIFRYVGMASVLVVLLFCSMYTLAQTTAGTILGNVTEQSGAVITGTQVTLTNIGTGAMLQTVTNGSGFYQFVNVPPGSYRVTVSKEGFKTVTREPIDLQVEGSVQINLVLEVGSQSQKVTVTARTPLIRSETTSLGLVVDQRETTELPLNGRNPFNLAALTPSVIQQGQVNSTPTGQNPFGFANLQIGGGFANQSVSYLDGAPLNTEYDNNTALVPTQDSLQEFKVDVNNLGPQYGRLAGGAIQFRTKSGTNQLHGSAWEFLRNKVLNANTYFGNQAHLHRPAFTQNQYGVNVGGPVFIPHLYDGRNKTFFFVNWEGFALRQGQTFVETVPTAAEIGGNLSALATPIYDPLTTCGASPGVACAPGQTLYNRTAFPGEIIPKNRLNPTAVAYLKRFYPAPNTVGGPAGVNNFTANASTGGNNYETVVHIDQNVSDKQHISARYSYWTNNNLPIDPLGTGICQDRCGEIFTTNNFIFDDTYTFNSSTILDMNVSYLRFVYNRSALLKNFSLSEIGMPAALNSQVQFPGPPVMSIQNFDTAGTFSSQGADSTITNATDDDRVAGNLTKFVGNHTLQFGGEFLRATFNYAQTNISSGDFNFSNQFTAANGQSGGGGQGLASFLLGYPNSGSALEVIPVAAEQLYPGLYANDDWRATQKLTLHVGARWEDEYPWTERHNRLSYWDSRAINPLLAAHGINRYPGSVELVASPTRSSRHNIDNDPYQFSPRAGLSYGFTPNTVLSMGYGIFWLPTDVAFSLSPNGDSINSFGTPFNASINNGLTPAADSAANVGSPGLANGTVPNGLSDPFPGGIIAPPGRNPSFQKILLGNGVTEAFPKNPYAYTQQWNVSLQQQIGNSFVLDIAYGAAKGTHLPFYSLQRDQLPDADLKLGNALNTPVANPFFGIVNPNYSLGAATIPAGQLLRPIPQYNGVASAGAGEGDSTYNSLQVTASKRFSRGASINAAYTLAKLISNTDTLTAWLEPAIAGAYGGIQDNNNLKAEKSLSSDDVRNNLVIAYVYDIPVGRGLKYGGNMGRLTDYAIGGWGLEGQTILQSGLPLGLNTSENLTNSFGGGSRPNVVPGCPKQVNGSAVSRLNHWFNTSCFTQPAPFTFGDEPRNDPQLRAAGIADWDSSLFKNFPVDKNGRVQVQFRAEVFNLFNRVQFGYPGLTQGTSNFGVVNSQYNNPRLLQFALRINY
ncbi:MAG TPA: carboxypeptidase-like regulatory domain-containing protein [Acidobacteriaceae bacterium]|nr:carboxypeptidase-like regulatory domain-containing protein [Acidobacteriaceae bacterium]